MNEREYQLLHTTVERLVHRNATVHLRNILNKTHPADIAYLFKLLNERSARTIFDLLPNLEIAAEVLSEMETGVRNEFLPQVDINRLIEILLVMADDDVADLLAELPKDLRERIIELMPDKETQEVTERLSFREDTAGRIMTTDFLALPESMSAHEATQEVRKAAETEMVFYLYVVDDQGCLSGVLSLRQLVMAPDDEPLAEIIMRDVIKVHVDTDQEEAARMVSRYNLLAIPVVDDSQKLVGIITVDDIIDVLRKEATEDILKMAGTSEEEISSYSAWRSARVRLPWLFATFIGGIIAVTIIAGFEGGFKEQVALFASLAAFMPIITGMGGNVGSQSLAITVRGLATGRIDTKLIWRLLYKSLKTGLILGLTYGLLLGLAGWLLKGDPLIGLIVGIAISLNMTVAAGVGTFLPLIAVKLKIDPAVASGPFVTTSIDILGLTIYFLTAYLLIMS